MNQHPGLQYRKTECSTSCTHLGAALDAADTCAPQCTNPRGKIKERKKD